MTIAAPAHKRILLKLSGEALMGDDSFGINRATIVRMVEEIADVTRLGVQVAVVIGGGNIFRGDDFNMNGVARSSADQIGMLATLMNGIALRQALESLGSTACLMTALECPRVAETYHWHKAMQYLSESKILIFVGGTGNPYFTTDTAAALRAKEIGAEILLKATKVDGIYNKDPNKFDDAVKYTQLSYEEALSQKLKIMDATAFALCMSESIPIFVFNMERLYTNSLNEILMNPNYGTLVKEEIS
mgnify:CR=1 FL=1